MYRQGIGSQHFKETGLQVLDLIRAISIYSVSAKRTGKVLRTTVEDVSHGKGDSGNL
jgi:hypothetical protein